MTLETEPKKGKSRGRRILLIVSLGLNVLVLCAVIGAFIGFSRHSDVRPVAMDGPGAVYVRALEFDDKRKLGKQIRQAYRASGAGRAEDRVLIDEMVAALRSDPFEAEALRNVRVALDGNAGMRRQAAFDVWLAYVEDMTQEQRISYADRMHEVLESKAHGHKKGKPPKD